MQISEQCLIWLNCQRNLLVNNISVWTREEINVFDPPGQGVKGQGHVILYPGMSLFVTESITIYQVLFKNLQNLAVRNQGSCSLLGQRSRSSQSVIFWHNSKTTLANSVISKNNNCHPSNSIFTVWRNDYHSRFCLIMSIQKFPK